MVNCLNDPVVPQETKTPTASHLRGQGPSLPDVPRAVHELLARRACLSEVQVLGGLADEPHERIIRCGLEEARVKGRDELTQTNSVLRPSPALAFSKNWLASMSVLGPGCSLTRGWDVKLSVMFLSGSLFSPR